MLTNSITRSEYKALNRALYALVGITLEGERDAITVHGIASGAVCQYLRYLTAEEIASLSPVQRIAHEDLYVWVFRMGEELAA